MFGLFGGNSPSYRGTAAPQPSAAGGFGGIISRLFGGNQTVTYRKPAPEPEVRVDSDPAPTETTDDELEPKRAVTVVVVLDSEALADAVAQKLTTNA